MDFNKRVAMLPDDMIFEIKQYFLRCVDCRKIIKDEEIKEQCGLCKKTWCCGDKHTDSKYLEASIKLCHGCMDRFNQPTVRKRRQNVNAYNFMS